ncbi:MAG: hypothetical protein HQK84_11910 [Nitrospinae bacterium]|nr:hypothetical protein [Nitrospinota bacterium]
MDMIETIFDAAIGFFVGILLTYLGRHIPQIKYFFKSLKSDPYKQFYGNYFVYSWKFLGNGYETSQVINGSLEITKNTFGSPYVYLEQNGNDFYFHLKGRLRIHDNVAYIHLVGIGHAEEVMFVFHKPLTLAPFTFATAVGCLVTPKRDPASKLYFISHKPLSDSEIQEYLKLKRTTILKNSEQDSEVDNILMQDGLLPDASTFINTVISIKSKSK